MNNLRGDLYNLPEASLVSLHTRSFLSVLSLLTVMETSLSNSSFFLFLSLSLSAYFLEKIFEKTIVGSSEEGKMSKKTSQKRALEEPAPTINLKVKGQVHICVCVFLCVFKGIFGFHIHMFIYTHLHSYIYLRFLLFFSLDLDPISVSLSLSLNYQDGGLEKRGKGLERGK